MGLLFPETAALRDLLERQIALLQDPAERMRFLNEFESQYRSIGMALQTYVNDTQRQLDYREKGS